MSRTKSLKIRLTEAEYEKVKTEADKRQVSAAEVLRDLIKQLPG